MKTTIYSSLLAASIAMYSGACCLKHTDHETEMQTLANRLLDLTGEVATQVLNDPGGTANLSDDDLLARATARDPSLRQEFQSYLVKTHREGSNVSVLVCTRDGAHGLMEDTVCVKGLDKALWRDPKAPCESTITLATACAIP